MWMNWLRWGKLGVNLVSEMGKSVMEHLIYPRVIGNLSAMVGVMNGSAEVV